MNTLESDESGEKAAIIPEINGVAKPKHLKTGTFLGLSYAEERVLYRLNFGVHYGYESGYDW